MSNWILYLLEVSAVLAVLYGLYRVLLSRETFFTFNRCFLLASLVLSFLFPVLRLDLTDKADHVIDQPLKKLSDVRSSYYRAWEDWSYLPPDNGIADREPEVLTAEKGGVLSRAAYLAIIVYGMGVAYVLARLLGSFGWVGRLRNVSQKDVVQGLSVIKVAHPIAPFSFLSSVFVHQDVVTSEDLDQILAHERIHIRERHSWDLIFVQLSAARLWFNPAVWQLIKSLKTTHEYIADRKTIDQGYSLVAYQTLLLRQLISHNAYGSIHNFNLSFIKKRITMMNIKKSGWTGQVRVAFALSFALLFSLLLAQCNSQLDEQMLQESFMNNASGITEIGVPVLPASDFQYPVDLSNSVKLTVADDVITINGEPVELDQIVPLLERISGEKDIMEARINHQQSMARVREVQGAFREANRLKFLYLGQTREGEPVNVRILLPPYPDHPAYEQMPIIDDEYARENNISLLNIRMGELPEATQQQKVFEFVSEQAAQHRYDYVVSARFSDDNTFQDYLASIYHLQEGFYRVYDDRARELFGKHFWELTQNREQEGYGEMYDKIKKEIPMNISIAED